MFCVGGIKLWKINTTKKVKTLNGYNEGIYQCFNIQLYIYGTTKCYNKIMKMLFLMRPKCGENVPWSMETKGDIIIIILFLSMLRKNNNNKLNMKYTEFVHLSEFFGRYDTVCTSYVYRFR